MNRHVRPTVAAALPCLLLVTWALLLVFLGAAPGANATPGPLAAPSASPAPPLRSGPARPEVRRTAEHDRSDTVQQRTTAAEPAVRLPGFPPALLPLVHTAGPGPLLGAFVAGPRQERAPPRDVYDPRYTRGPPSTWHS
ncbi:hypothetical protein F4556_006655 [Kitasatospora gansuensis]|uniref:Uncharacterized protein n=1 Tax=Kitasatospora gansuensis TaxID=258050 RepID=A0A7W7WLJ3_9ACTN|nr:hypothetical protein [Kitasatospora gansuensis]MBB4951120.1 hypothetical protein [Kitasatospora gansuensis]